jgi:hypothetical protein
MGMLKKRGVSSHPRCLDTPRFTVSNPPAAAMHSLKSGFTDHVDIQYRQMG